MNLRTLRLTRLKQHTSSSSILLKVDEKDQSYDGNRIWLQTLEGVQLNSKVRLDCSIQREGNCLRLHFVSYRM